MTIYALYEAHPTTTEIAGHYRVGTFNDKDYADAAAAAFNENPVTPGASYYVVAQ